MDAGVKKKELINYIFGPEGVRQLTELFVWLLNVSNIGDIIPLADKLTHSLVGHRQWRLATADDHSIVFLLHCSLSCDISFSWM